MSLSSVCIADLAQGFLVEKLVINAYTSAWQRSEPKAEEIVYNHQVLVADVRMTKDHLLTKSGQNMIDNKLLQWTDPFQ